jgi:hypothetical protein
VAVSGQFSVRVCSAARRLRRQLVATLALDSEDFGQSLVHCPGMPPSPGYLACKVDLYLVPSVGFSGNLNSPRSSS